LSNAQIPPLLLSIFGSAQTPIRYRPPPHALCSNLSAATSFSLGSDGYHPHCIDLKSASPLRRFGPPSRRLDPPLCNEQMNVGNLPLPQNLTSH
jgi:hypothetical protein